ncbi:MAG: ABC transporter permease, partial [Roseibium sp.]|nr:ABC transporter permease [Roseibium sp.]
MNTTSTKRRFDMPAMLAWFVVAMVLIGLFSPIFKPDLGVMEVPRLSFCLVILAIAGVRYELGFMRNRIGDVILGLVTALAAWLLVTTVSNHTGQATLGFWALVAATWAASWLFVERLAIW